MYNVHVHVYVQYMYGVCLLTYIVHIWHLFAIIWCLLAT